MGLGMVFVTMVSATIGRAADDPLAALLATIEDQAKSDVEKARQAAAQNPPTPGTIGITPNTGFTPTVLTFTTQVRQSIADGNYDNALNAAGQLASFDSSDDFQKSVVALVALIGKMRDDQQAQLDARIDHAFAAATQAIQTAKSPKEIDAPLTELLAIRDLTNSNGYWNQRRQGLSQKLQGAVDYVKGWQDYLEHLSVGQVDQARNSLRNIANNDFSFTPIPRSDLLQLAEAPVPRPSSIDAPSMAGKDLDAIVSQLKGLPDIPQGVTALQGYQRIYHDDSLNQAVGDLESVGRADREFTLGRYTVALQQLHLNSLNNTPLDLAIRALQRQMVLEVVGKTMDIKDVLPVKPDEPVPDYLLRLAAEYQKDARWADLRRVLVAYGDVVFTNGIQPEWLRADVAGIKAYQIGQVQEQAGQPIDAIRSYRRSLALLGTYFPSSVPGDALKALQKSAPDAYDAVMKAEPGAKEEAN